MRGLKVSEETSTTFWAVVRADLKSNVDSAGKSPLRFWITVIGKLLIAPQVHAVLTYRIGHALGRLGLRPVGMLLKIHNLASTGAEIHPSARIGPGFCLVHTSGVVIGQGVIVGSDCRMHHGVTLGEPGRGSRAAMANPIIGDHVSIGAHAVVMGPARVGNGAVIGANSVVVSDIPDNAVAVGIPARVIRINAG